MINIHLHKQQPRMMIASRPVPAQRRKPGPNAKNIYSKTHRARSHQKKQWNPAHHREPSPSLYPHLFSHGQHRSEDGVTSNGRDPPSDHETIPSSLHRSYPDPNNAALEPVKPNYMKSYPAKRGDRWSPDTHLPGRIGKTKGSINGTKRHKDVGSTCCPLPMMRTLTPKSVLQHPNHDGMALAAAAVAAEPALIDITKSLDLIALLKEQNTAPVWLASQFDAWVMGGVSCYSIFDEMVGDEEFKEDTQLCVLPMATRDIIRNIISACDN